MADPKGKTPVGTVDTVPAEKGAESGPRPSLPMRWGVWVAEHRWHVLLGWLVLFIVAAAAYPHLMASLSAPDYSVTGSDSAQVTNLIQSDFSAAGAEQEQAEMHLPHAARLPERDALRRDRRKR